MDKSDPSRPGLIIVTCGPSYEPIDQVRRITNHSTGTLGIQLSNALAAAGRTVVCLIGEGATFPGPLAAGIRRIVFTTNEDLLRRLTELSGEPVAAVYHAAALCDFRVEQAYAADGTPIGSAKIPTRAGAITLTLAPAPKVISHLRALFPASRLIGWKYELAGTREETLEKGRRQIAENGTDVCIVNGAAYGAGFGYLEQEAPVRHFPTKAELCEYLSSPGIL